ncbi:PrgI family protein [Patescibacteria group bacterium]|nr:PrgI family protein [Patescibacteria group bacterium]
MEFTVPQFIEREPKIVGPLTFKQFIFVAVAGGACFFLYFFIGKKNLPLFIIIAVILMGGSLALCFLRIKGYTLPMIIKNFFVYSVSAKIFLWRRKIVSPKFKKVERFEKAEVEEGATLKMAKKSHLQKLSTQVETRTIK